MRRALLKKKGREIPGLLVLLFVLTVGDQIIHDAWIGESRCVTQ
jgi:hypothetical protein